MSILVAVSDSREGRQAVVDAAQEARRLGTGLVVVNLALVPVDATLLPDDVPYELVERHGTADADPLDTVLSAVEARPGVTRIVVGVRRRSPLGKAVLGSITQRLLLEATVPVLSVKVPSG